MEENEERKLLDTLGDLTIKEHWDKFVSVRASNGSLELYAEWPQIRQALLACLSATTTAPETSSSTSPPSPSLIPIPVCGGSELSEHLDDAGFHIITDIDFSKVVIPAMLRRNDRSRPEMKDMTDMKIMDSPIALFRVNFTGSEVLANYQIVDSLVALLRVDFMGSGEHADHQQKMAPMFSRLTKIAEEFNVSVYMSKQVIADPGGGHVLAHAAILRLMFRKGKGEQPACLIFDATNLPESEAVFPEAGVDYSLLMQTKKSLSAIKGLSDAKVEQVSESSDKLVKTEAVKITTGSQAQDELLAGCGPDRIVSVAGRFGMDTGDVIVSILGDFSGSDLQKGGSRKCVLGSSHETTLPVTESSRKRKSSNRQGKANKPKEDPADLPNPIGIGEEGISKFLKDYVGKNVLITKDRAAWYFEVFIDDIVYQYPPSFEARGSVILDHRDNWILLRRRTQNQVSRFNVLDGQLSNYPLIQQRTCEEMVGTFNYLRGLTVLMWTVRSFKKRYIMILHEEGSDYWRLVPVALPVVGRSPAKIKGLKIYGDKVVGITNTNKVFGLKLDGSVEWALEYPTPSGFWGNEGRTTSSMLVRDPSTEMVYYIAICGLHPNHACDYFYIEMAPMKNGRTDNKRIKTLLRACEILVAGQSGFIGRFVDPSKEVDLFEAKVGATSECKHISLKSEGASIVQDMKRCNFPDARGTCNCSHAWIAL